MIALQLVCLLFAIGMLYWTYLGYKRGTLRMLELVTWSLIWGAFALIVLFPTSTSVMLQRLRINRTMDLLMVLGFMLVWVVVFRNYMDVRRLQGRLQQLVRELALREDRQP